MLSNQSLRTIVITWVLSGALSGLAGAAEPDPEKQLHAAQQAYIAGDYQKAIDLARPLTGDATAGKRAWRIVGAGACNRKDAELAGTAMKAVDASSKQFITYVCQRTGTKLK